MHTYMAIVPGSKQVPVDLHIEYTIIQYTSTIVPNLLTLTGYLLSTYLWSDSDNQTRWLMVQLA